MSPLSYLFMSSTPIYVDHHMRNFVEISIVIKIKELIWKKGELSDFQKFMRKYIVNE